MRMLCIAAEADPFGYVLVDGVPPTHSDIAKLVGSTEPEVDLLMAELELRAVFSRNRAGIIYSRRMVRDEKKKKIAKQNGKTGGNPNLKKQTTIPPSDNPQDKGEVGAPLSLARAGPLLPLLPHNHITTLATLPTEGLDKAPVIRVCEALGLSFTASAERLNWPAMVGAMIDAGLDLDTDILPACVEAKARAITNLTWVRKRAEGEQARRKLVTETSEASKTEEARKWRHEFLKNYNLPVADEDVGKVEGETGTGGWRWIKNRSGNGVWQDVFGVGPPPHDPRTLVTEEELAGYPAAKAKRDKLKAGMAK